MKKRLLEKNEVIMKRVNLPIATSNDSQNRSIDSITEDNYDIIHKDDEFSKEFVDNMKRMEKEEFIEVNYLEELFE